MIRSHCFVAVSVCLSFLAVPGVGAEEPTQDVQVVARIQPKYPARARDSGVEGWVIVGATVDANGNAYDFRILESSPTGFFESAALQAFQEWQFSPAMRDGEPVMAKARVRINFNLD